MLRNTFFIILLLLFGCTQFQEECKALEPDGISISADGKYIAAYNTEKLCVLDMKDFRTVNIFKDPNTTYLAAVWEKSSNLVFFQKNKSYENTSYWLSSFNPERGSVISASIRGEIYDTHPRPSLSAVNDSLVILSYELDKEGYDIERKQVFFDPATLKFIKTREIFFERSTDFSSDAYYAESRADYEGTEEEIPYYLIRKTDEPGKSLRFKLPLGQEQFAFSKNRIIYIKENGKNASLQIKYIGENSTDIFITEEKTVKIDYENLLRGGPSTDNIAVSPSQKYLILSGSDHFFSAKCDAPIKTTCNVAFILVFDLERNKVIYADESERVHQNYAHFSVSSSDELIYVFSGQTLGDAKRVKL